jgi:hypothetical protein
MLPVSVAVPPVFVMDTVPVVVKLPTDWVAVPEIVNPPEPEVTVPLLTKLPDNVMRSLPGVMVAPLLIFNVLIERSAFKDVVPPVIFKLLKDVKVDAGNVFVAVSSTVPVLGVQLVPVPPTTNEPALKIEFALIVNTAGELLALPRVKLPHSNVEPSTKVITPVLLSLVFVPPIVTAPVTVNFGLPLLAKVKVPLVFELLPPKDREAHLKVPSTVTLLVPDIVTASLGLGTPPVVL